MANESRGISTHRREKNVRKAGGDDCGDEGRNQGGEGKEGERKCMENKGPTFQLALKTRVATCQEKNSAVNDNC